MKIEDSNPIGTLALDFINYTHRNIFLTGGAGTGKTTFLKFLRRNTHKKMAIAAPTGVAAINAGGTTIHALFHLPPRPLDEATVKNIRLTGKTKSLVRELELLIIDEVSMLRADVLDAVDNILQEVRQDIRPLGGLQVVFIGDLFQLPPIENRQDIDKLQGIYTSLYFTDSNVFQALNMLKLELTVVHRQSDPTFISLLESVRKGYLTGNELELLNSLSRPNWIEKRSIVLTTHNRLAAELNEQQMQNLEGISRTFQAEIIGEFSDDQCPVDNILHLKIDCRVMIIKNDNSDNRLYYNGKIGHVTGISDENIKVKFDDNTTVIFERETWSNITYSINTESDSIQEDILGTFRQFPLKLAWAITVHKSQGLTFEQAVIDVADAFAPGQTYVALSRVRALEGICLKSIIPLSAINSPRVDESKFQVEEDLNTLSTILLKDKTSYVQDFLLNAFNWQLLLQSINNIKSSEPILENLHQTLDKLGKHTQAFTNEIRDLITKDENPDWQNLSKRITQAESYFNGEIKQNCIDPLKHFINKYKDDFKFRGEINDKKNYIKLFQKKIVLIGMSKRLMNGIINRLLYAPALDTKINIEKDIQNKINLDFPPLSKIDSTELQSLQLFLTGKSIVEISDIRSLGVPTVEYHLSLFIPTGEIKITDIIPQKTLNEILPLLSEMNAPSIAQLRPVIGGKLSLGQLQAISIYLKLNK